MAREKSRAVFLSGDASRLRRDVALPGLGCHGRTMIVQADGGLDGFARQAVNFERRRHRRDADLAIKARQKIVGMPALLLLIERDGKLIRHFTPAD